MRVFLGLAFVLTMISSVIAQTSAPVALGEEVNQAKAQITDLVRTKKIAEVEDEVERLRSKWMAKSQPSCAGLMFDTCGLLAKSKEQPAASTLADRLARETIAQGTEIPASYEFRLATFVMPPGLNQAAEKLSEARAQSATIVLAAWKRLHDGMDPKFDPDHATRPPLNDSGVMHFADPAVQASFDEQKLKLKKYADYYAEQVNLREVLNAYNVAWERAVVRIYGDGPDNTTALKEMMLKYVSDEGERVRLLGYVEEVRSNASKQH